MKKLKDFLINVNKILVGILLISLIIFLITEIAWLISVLRTSIFLSPNQFFDQIFVGHYTLAVTIILTASALIGGGVIWLTSSFKSILEERHKEIENFYKKSEKIYNELFDKRTRIIASLQNLKFSNRATWLFLAIQTKQTGAASFYQEVYKNLETIFESAAFFEAQTMRLFTAEDHKDVEAAAIFIFHRLHDEIGKKLLEDRLTLETSIENPDPKVIESLSRLLGAW